EETGFGYFGARYMDHELMTMWLSVDPMADKYPGISPYAYCAWNPVKLVDPDGEDIIGSIVGAAIGFASEIVSQTVSNGLKNVTNEKKFFDDWSSNIDWFDVATSSLTGALDGLVPGAGKFGKAIGKNGCKLIKYGGKVVGDLAKAEFDIKQSTGCLIGGYNKSFRAVIIDASCNIISDVMNTASFPENLDNLSIKTIFNKDCPKLLGRLFGTSFCSSAFNGIGVVFKQLFPGKPHIEIPWIDKIERDDYGIEKKKRYIFNHSLSKY
ncbi:MAG: hypothetical protein IJT04_05510, partial [Bacteroidales bacterium]|nr:hypothetical protein [Bacteroidales bacterium]